MNLVDRGAFHDFPKRPRADNIPSYLGLWKQLKREHGYNLPVYHLRPMLINMLPEEVAEDHEVVLQVRLRSCANSGTADGPRKEVHMSHG